MHFLLSLIKNNTVLLPDIHVNRKCEKDFLLQKEQSLKIPFRPTIKHFRNCGPQWSPVLLYKATEREKMYQNVSECIEKKRI